MASPYDSITSWLKHDLRRFVGWFRYQRIRRVVDWFRYERLHHYPQLQRFEREEALARLKAYEKQMSKPGQGWLIFAAIIILVGSYALGWAVIGELSAACYLPAYCVIVAYWYCTHRRLRKRVQAIITAELGDGKLHHCLDCGYDLRGSDGELCPECGQPIRVAPPSEPSRP
jgi:hypothetical protein